MSCLKRGGPLVLQKGYEQELEGKSPFVFVFLATCYFQEDPFFVKCCYHHFFSFFHCSSMKRNCCLFFVVILQESFFYCCYNTKRGTMRWASSFFCSLQCSLAKRMTTMCWACRCLFFFCYSTTLQRGRRHHLMGHCFLFSYYSAILQRGRQQR